MNRAKIKVRVESQRPAPNRDNTWYAVLVAGDGRRFHVRRPPSEWRKVSWAVGDEVEIEDITKAESAAEACMRRHLGNY